MKKSLFIIAFLAFAVPFMSMAQGTYPFGTIMNRVYQDVAGGKANADKNAKNSLLAMREDGSWGNIDYKATDITKWKPSTHLDRITTMLQAYTTKGGAFYADRKLYDGIVSGLQFWYKADPKSDNWWHNEISVPQKMGILLVIANYGDTKLPDDLKADLIERMKRGDVDKKTGANKTDIASHYFYRALLTEDIKLLSFSLDQLFEPVQLVSGEEGLQYDFSYLQHGPQLYISGYGEVYVSGVLKVANYVKGTPYALNKEKLTLFSTFYRNTFLQTIRGNYIDFNVEGRGVSRRDRLKKAEKSTLEEFKLIDPENSAVWDKAIARFSDGGTADYGVKPTHQHFWTADYALHVRANYTFSVRTSSDRTKRAETGNKENLYGRYLSDGATNIQVSGPEYFNIMPVWEWDKIPGTTSRNYELDRLMTKTWGETGFNAFSGGVSDGVYGATAYELKYDSVAAKKAWFMFDKEIVCLGVGINSNAKEEVTTTLNQAWLNGNVTLSDSRKVVNGALIDYRAPNQSWLYHANTGYYFPEGGALSLSTQKQTGNWFKINNSFPKDEVTGEVFKFWINHGTQPKDAKYAYIILPAIKSDKDIKNFNAQTLSILSNTPAHQSVYHRTLKILQAVFYTPAEIETDTYYLSVDKPCIVMVNDAKKEIYVSDPFQKEKSVVVTLRNKKTSDVKVVNIDLPQGVYTGSTAKTKHTF